MAIDYTVNSTIEATEIIDVFKSVGWSKDPSDIVEAFSNSYYITAREDGKLVGFARAISDGYYYAGIYDVVVRPDYQKQGIGKAMMDMLTTEFRGKYIFLTSTEGNEAFYQRCGFMPNKTALWIPK